MKRTTICVAPWLCLSGVVANATESAALLEEVTVTATRREERLQDVPASISALTGDALDRAGIKGLTDLTMSVPAISFSNVVPGRTIVTIRGIYAGSGEPTTGIYLDEYSLHGGLSGEAFMGSADPRIIDLDRVEVLRGPQGTLYGTGSMGGTIRYITTPPSLNEVSGRALAELSGTRQGGANYRLGGAFTTPLAQDRLGVRVSVFGDETSGYVDRLAVDGTRLEADANGGTAYGGRLSLLWQPDETLSVSPTLLYQISKFHGESEYDSNQPEFARIARFAEPGEDEFLLAGLTAKKQIGALDLISITEYFDRSVVVNRDTTDSILNGLVSTLGGANIPSFRAGGMTNHNVNSTRMFSQELRLSATGGERLDWLVGGYFADMNKARFQDIFDPSFNEIAAGLGLPARTLGDSVFLGDADRNQEFYAVFADVTYRIAPALRASAGVRWFKVDGELLRGQGGLIGGGAYVQAPTLDASEDGYNPRFGLDYKLSEDSLLYASASKGFRAGGPNPPLPVNDCVTAGLAALGLSEAPSQYASDSLWSYEIGSKNSLIERRLLLNTGLFYVDWKDIPQSITLRDPATGQNCPFQITDNVGTASVRGAELELTASVHPDVTLNANVAYTDAQAEKDAPTVAATAGEQLQYTPRWTYGLSGEYRRFYERFQLFARAYYNWRGDSRRSFDQNSPYFRQESFGMVNVATGLTTDSWTLELFAQNLTDEAPVLNEGNRLSRTAFYSGYGFRSTLQPRTIGVRLNYQF